METVTVEAEKHSGYFIALGSNTEAVGALALARRRLEEVAMTLHCSPAEWTAAIGCHRNNAPFLNQVVLLQTALDTASLKALLKAIEKEAGRSVEEKEQEIVRLDLDLLMAHGRLLKPEDWERPYVKRMVADLMHTIANKQLDTERTMKFIGIIPARYASTRFPAKPLAMLGGKTVIQRVYEQVAGVLDDAYVATDDERIEAAVKAFGGKVVMTSVHHKSGTDRCYEACCKVGGDFDVVVNIQGDEPFIHPSQLEAVKACFQDPTTQIATLVKPFPADAPIEAIENPNSPKVVLNKNMNALYFSRSVIPYRRGVEREKWTSGHTYYKHIGLYAYRTEVLKEITALPQSSLELAESLEQLRWLENGYLIKVGLTDVETIGIDTPEDLQRAEEFLKASEQHGK
ncbi:MAG: 3-deoxy-manno-octulosonate cytidylyltransferase [Bacteroides sp.]|nr:3-deoxy-manno-octulosonate cytidylyltransferase [Bacteroides sp.]